MTETGFPAEIERIVTKHITARHELIEQFCERSLVDPLGRGVLVTDGLLRTTVALSDDVPWGTIAYLSREMTDDGR